MAVAVKKLVTEGKIERALVLDFDLHHGDGTAHVFADSGEAVYFHPEAATGPAFLEEVERALRCPTPHDIVAVSAGFDRHQKDWGDLLATEDYFAIGRSVREHAHRRCRGRRFGVLEGATTTRSSAKTSRALSKGWAIDARPGRARAPACG